MRERLFAQNAHAIKGDGSPPMGGQKIDMRHLELLNERMDRLACLDIRFLNSRPAYKSCGYMGMILALVLALALAAGRGGSPAVILLIGSVASLTFLALAMTTKIIRGAESLVYYHHLITILITTALALRLLHIPILFYLDITVLSVGLFHACGRLGCLMVGCCHGRPSRWGIRYGEKHAAAGFPPYLINVRLFPIQAVESLWVLCLVLVGSALVLRNQQPGEALAWYLIGYGAGRFCFEFARGDVERRYLLGFSEAQWTSLFLVSAVMLAEILNVLTFEAWQVWITACFLLLALILALRRSLDRTARHKLLHARHLKEIVQTLERISETATEMSSKPPHREPVVRVGCTSLGIRISAGRIRSDAGNAYHYALSSQSSAMTEVSVRILAELILRLKHPRGLSQLIQGHQGVYHLLVVDKGTINISLA